VIGVAFLVIVLACHFLASLGFAWEEKYSLAVINFGFAVSDAAFVWIAINR
jgi:hypothetical protein